MERYEERCGCFSSTVSRIDQAVLEEFVRSGAFERHLNRMRKVYSKKHEALLDGLKAFGKDFAVSGENAGLHVLVTDRKGRSEAWLKEQARQNGVRVYGLSEAMTEPDGCDLAATVLLGFGGLTEEEIEDGIKRLEKAWM